MDAGLGTRGQRLWPLIGWLLPFWCALLLLLLDRDYFVSVLRSPPEAFGLPAGLLMLVVGGVLGSLGVLAGLASRSRGAAVAVFLFLTLPASLIAIATPAVILSIIKLSPASG